ncbi:uncharacterized protein BDR25DRAFT_361282 [Lindgomyces ingoldianus]|uniref:Uncharacterized protein n=1 Tax=Lindgomyces ingoldianus TaxID=673940 RepID=A0ACB6QDP9_9PLEO|nr:uncharacterized protein BDR25DRAFT_361282 [Lindgomyces ingoldianus]KAF2464738.1 hypothetical protein BDR25DRAFT_361282 [Lindgomyces ingoldianus]
MVKDMAFYVGSAKLTEVEVDAKLLGAKLVLVNFARLFSLRQLSPSSVDSLNSINRFSFSRDIPWVLKMPDCSSLRLNFRKRWIKRIFIKKPGCGVFYLRVGLSVFVLLYRSVQFEVLLYMYARNQ